jgi:hypothetical protein
VAGRKYVRLTAYAADPRGAPRSGAVSVALPCVSASDYLDSAPNWKIIEIGNGFDSARFCALDDVCGRAVAAVSHNEPKRVKPACHATVSRLPVT